MRQWIKRKSPTFKKKVLTKKGQKVVGLKNGLNNAPRRSTLQYWYGRDDNIYIKFSNDFSRS